MKKASRFPQKPEGFAFTDLLKTGLLITESLHTHQHCSHSPPKEIISGEGVIELASDKRDPITVAVFQRFQVTVFLRVALSQYNKCAHPIRE